MDEFCEDIYRLVTDELARPLPQVFDLDLVSRVVEWLEDTGLPLSRSVLQMETSLPDMTRFPLPSSYAAPSGESFEESLMDKLKRKVTYQLLCATEVNGMIRQTKAKILAQKYVQHLRDQRRGITFRHRDNRWNSTDHEDQTQFLLSMIYNWMMQSALLSSALVLGKEAEHELTLAPMQNDLNIRMFINRSESLADAVRSFRRLPPPEDELEPENDEDDDEEEGNEIGIGSSEEEYDENNDQGNDDSGDDDRDGGAY